MGHDAGLRPAARTGVFISHAHEDGDLAEAVRELLEAALDLQPGDITCTSDANYGLDRGGDLSEEIRRRLTTAKALFLLATGRSKGKEWVQFECAYSASARDRGEMQFYVLTPTADERDAVPEPYRNHIAVTMSNGGDVWAFLNQLPGDLGHATTGLSRCTPALLDLGRHCAALERRGIDARHQREVTHGRHRTLRAVAASWILAAVLLTAVWWHFAAERETVVATLNEDWKAKLSAQAATFEQAWTRELQKVPFSGFFRGAGALPLMCSKVEVEVGTGTVETACDDEGVFVFKGTDLAADPLARIQMRVHIGSRTRRTVVDRGSVPVAISLTGGLQ